MCIYMDTLVKLMALHAGHVVELTEDELTALHEAEGRVNKLIKEIKQNGTSNEEGSN